MTQIFWAMPAIAVRDTAKHKRHGRRAGVGPTKYDHWTMLQDRLAGLSWAEIEKKHGVVNRTDRPGNAASGLCRNCRTAEKLSPSEVARIFPGAGK